VYRYQYTEYALIERELKGQLTDYSTEGTKDYVQIEGQLKGQLTDDSTEGTKDYVQIVGQLGKGTAYQLQHRGYKGLCSDCRTIKGTAYR
jgi:hypothetical protein